MDTGNAKVPDGYGMMILVKMKTAFALIGYLISYSSYLYCMANICMKESTQRLWNYYSVGILLIFIFVRESQRYIPILERELLSVSKITIVLTMIMIILHYHRLVNSVYLIMGVIDIGTLIATLMIVISAKRHGIFSIK